VGFRESFSSLVGFRESFSSLVGFRESFSSLVGFRKFLFFQHTIKINRFYYMGFSFYYTRFIKIPFLLHGILFLLHEIH